MLNILIGLAVSAFGLYNIVQAQLDHTIDTTPLWWAKMGGAVLVGGGIAIYNLLPHIQAGLAAMKGNTQTTPKDVKILPSAPLEPKAEENKDVESLYYLTERCKDVPEALDLCRKLNAILFDKHHEAPHV